MTTRPLAALASAATLLALALMQAPALADDTGVDLPAGLTEVDGGESADEATPVTAGRLLDHTTSSDSQNVYSFQRTIPGSTVMFGLTLLTTDPVVAKGRLRASVAYKEDDGTAVFCGRTVFDSDGRASAMPLQSRAGYTTQKAECATHEDLFLLVYNNKEAGVSEGVPYELDVWEVPPVTNLAKLPVTGYGSAQTFSPGEPTLEAEPGAWMAEATTLPTDETTQVDLPVGRISWFAVDVPFNQQLDAFASITDEDGAAPGAAVEMRILSPVGGIVGVPPVEADRFRPTATLGTGPASVETSSWLVSPRSRADYEPGDEFDSEGTLAAQPGTYYLAVYVGNTSGAEDATVSMELTPALLKGTGVFAEGADPQYAADVPAFPAPQGAEAQPIGTRSDASADPETSAAEPAADEGSSTTTTLVAGLLGAAAFLAVLGGVLLVRARRRA
ncbi:hypothetical protein H5V45_11665 [Nocardioides sp. KIGAM211]|uniref:Gram-positive cocci surface proteins LPxTG domain-containing protein n=1 Tax=Nocardioides luti TaxID=2761101 RepID=A0A7X0VAP1_9ACTN|nr:hypothetical protein [Nocardioides luti]MBB6627974.1 hypothetical protein [Nocardioides luti]